MKISGFSTMPRRGLQSIAPARSSNLYELTKRDKLTRSCKGSAHHKLLCLARVFVFSFRTIDILLQDVTRRHVIMLVSMRVVYVPKSEMHRNEFDRRILCQARISDLPLLLYLCGQFNERVSMPTHDNIAVSLASITIRLIAYLSKHDASSSSLTQRSTFNLRLRSILSSCSLFLAALPLFKNSNFGFSTSGSRCMFDRPDTSKVTGGDPTIPRPVEVGPTEGAICIDIL